jgi:hypothetical protein
MSVDPENKKVQYWVMDGRANYDIDEALVLVNCKTLVEAFRNVDDYGADTCIVKVEGEQQKLIYSLAWWEILPVWY